METTIKNVLGGLTQTQPPAPPPQQVTASYDQVELTDDEIKAALDAARSKKAAKIREVAYWESVNKPKQYPRFTTDQMQEYALNRGKTLVPKSISNPNGFVIDQKNHEVFKKLSGYFAGDADCGLDITKGLLIFGPLGCGKTVMMRCFSANPTRSFKEVSARTIAMEYSVKETGGNYTIEVYSTVHEVINSDKFFGQREIGLFIDDLGTETKKKHFGNETNVLEDIILNRYDNPYLKGQTHITSNLTADQIEEYYGPRVRSRLREMFNTITFSVDSPDRRK